MFQPIGQSEICPVKALTAVADLHTVHAFVVGVGDTRNLCFNTIPSTFVMVLMSINIDTEYLCIP